MMPKLNNARHFILPVFLSLLWMVMMSVTLLESDAYRYAALLLIAFAWITPIEPRALLKDRLAIACVIVGTYALVRFLVDLAVFKEKGASEWLYAFPLLFPSLGLALYKSWDVIAPSLFAFFTMALVLLMSSTHWGIIISGERASPLFHHNPIHGAVGCGFLFIGAFFWAAHQFERPQTPAARRWIGIVAVLVMMLALVNIYGSQSKGVWLAMAPTLLSLAVFGLSLRRERAFVLVLGSGLAVITVAVLSVSNNLVTVAGATSASLYQIGHHIADGQQLTDTLNGAIASQSTPPNLNERLQLWSNAIEVLRHSPVWGNGAGWLTLWQNTQYHNIQYTLLHNGYLEILVRHGVLGLAVYGAILMLFLRRLLNATRQGFLSRSAFACCVTCTVFFCFTLLTNSNNRLALGESFSLLFAAVAFAVSWKASLSTGNGERPRASAFPARSGSM